MRWLGAFLLVAGSLMGGVCAVGKLDRRVRRLWDLERTMVLFSRVMGQYALPTEELCAYLSETAPGAGSRLFAELLDNMRRRPEERLYTQWERSLASLGMEEKQPLSDFGRVLGAFGVQEQCAAAERCRAALADLAAEAAERRRKYGRVYIALPVAGGLLAAIVML